MVQRSVIVWTHALDTALTLYHVNPLSEGPMPLDMDTADIYGDSFFDLRSKVLPIECSDDMLPGWWKGDCHNAESSAPDLVVSKLSLQLAPSSRFGSYARCNVCNSSGVDPFSGLTCSPGAYLCSCGSYYHPYDCTERTTVGRENITALFGKFGQCGWETYIRAPWLCWSLGIVLKTGGMWYSTPRAGWCDAPGANPKLCTWSAKVEKVVNKTCSDATIYSAVESYAASSEGDECFARRCGGGTGAHFRNTSSICWIYCFYATILGEEALVPGGKVGGMPLERLVSAFELPFASVAAGGCPSVPPSPPAGRYSHKAGAWPMATPDSALAQLSVAAS